MKTYYGLSIDPGMSSGICLFSWTDEDAITVEGVWQITGGAPGMHRFLAGMTLTMMDGTIYFHGMPIDHLVMEKFTPHANEGFSLTRESAEPLRGEGVLIGMGFAELIEWGQPSQQYFMGGETLKEKKKRSREFLKLHGLYVTGSTLGRPDADDAISATLHAIAWLRRKRHMPTLLTLFASREE